MKKLLFLATIVICLVIIKNLLSSIYELWSKQDLITQTNNELEAEKKKNKTLKDQLATVESSSYIEEQARNKLFLVKPGETEIIIPTPRVSGAKVEPEKDDELPYWKQWWELFF